ncbi:LysR family transcriptional regulator [Nocardiopsis suaedae]|uniref:LysR family transcriptional regulator n=1 Tax=Nocardiopsis suaedae TaxID=3018444 RepID=A0ABT4TFJ5_9ACTN|nr:LysR family transcriptional regulator [Nocardiopsis suaedae]MDA2803371.1 LysR family transcriptional regulator [Nocardiopsis suaedae]
MDMTGTTGGRTAVELRHLRALAAIGDEGTVTGAAEALRLSQPSVSRTLEQLERAVGVRLVERTTRSLALTEEGRRLWEHAHAILNRLDAALAEVRPGPRPFRLGIAWAAFGPLTVPLLQEWRGAHPETPVRIHRRNDPEEALRRSEVDAALLRTAPSTAPGVRALPLLHERRVAALAESDPLAASAQVHLADLAERDVALCTTAATTGVDLWPEGRRPRAVTVADVEEWLSAIATGEAVGVTAEGTVHSHPAPGVRYVPITDAPPVQASILWPEEPTHPGTEAFVAHVFRTVRCRSSSTL